MREVFSDDTAWIREGVLRLGERHAMLGLIFEVFLDIPFEAGLAHGTRLADQEAQHHIKIWLSIWLRLLNLLQLTPGLSGGPQATMLSTTQKRALWAVRLQAFVR
jgi:hypothetical protein